MKFVLLKGDIEEFAILEDKFPDNLNELFVENSIKAKLNISAKSLALTNTVKFVIGDKILIKIRSSMYFEIEESSWHSLIKGNKIVFEKSVIQHLGIITTGATRGMLIAKCANTPYSKLILPPIKISELIHEDMVFEKEEN